MVLPAAIARCWSRDDTTYGALRAWSLSSTEGFDMNAATISYGMALIGPSSGVLRMRGERRPALPRSRRTSGCPLAPCTRVSTSPGYIRCGFSTCGFTYQISGQNQGSRRNVLAMSQSVSPRLTVYDWGAVSWSTGPWSAADACDELLESGIGIVCVGAGAASAGCAGSAAVDSALAAGAGGALASW